MKKIYNLKHLCFAILLASGLLSAQYSNGVIIANEGNFGLLNAEISFLDYNTLEVTNDIYKTVNNEDLGNVLQNVGFNNDLAYLVINASNKIIVVNRDSFVKQEVITEALGQPRYITFNNEKAYVTNMDNKNVNVYSTSDHSLLKVISVNLTTEEIEAVGNYVFVQNGSFGSGNKITVIDTETDEIVKTFEVETAIQSIATDGTFLYALSSGAGFTHLYKIDAGSLEIVADKRVDTISGGRKMGVSDDIVFFVGNATKVYGVASSLTDEPTLVTSVPDNSWSTFYGFNVIGDYIFSGDAKGFVAPSEVKIFNVTDGAEIKTVNTTIGVNEFYNNKIASLAVNEEVLPVLQVSIYPNPVVDYVQIKGVNKANVEVFDVNGRLVKKLSYNGQMLNVSNLNSGLYFFVIQTEKGKITKKVLVK